LRRIGERASSRSNCGNGRFRQESAAVKGFPYAIAPFIAVDHPDWSPNKCITESRRIVLRGVLRKCGDGPHEETRFLRETRCALGVDGTQ
jgi:hypothetical protein